LFKFLKEFHELFDLFYSGNYSESTSFEPVKMEVGKKSVVEPDESMPEAQLRLVVELKARDIYEKAKGTPKELLEAKAFDSLAEDTKRYQTKAQIKRIHSILDYVGTGKKVLDCAGGSGYISSFLKQAGNDVTVLDYSEIQLLRAKWVRKLNTALGDVNNIPFLDNTFDVVILAEILDKCEEMSPALAEAERVCKKGGQVIVTIPIMGSKDVDINVKKSISMTLITDETNTNNSIVLSIKESKGV
jgi:2-polyprenyl-3-methyl-5-hydroxy-6-metoxy-1,4-benzoquinol methylase